MPHAESGVNGSGNDRLDRLQETSLRITRWLALLAVGAVLAGAALTVTDVVLRSATRQGVFGANDAARGLTDEVANLLGEPGALDLLRAYAQLPRLSRPALVTFLATLGKAAPAEPEASP